ncbi:MAG TPA: UDP-N-acetylmuramoyl-L-alanyl-D-glutamate--2,6-diaminopimelate ligase [Candidatus Rubrimentiphilum sp.]|nr:UDP-N-acetylmuramoyl-L-alanyl-D-glutamate--2,6-diaminopimelate ligase [Candidatus Rubrimentiphilum sp.]
MNEPGVPLESLLEALPQNITSLAIDSRAVTPGALFFALRGEHTDGHRYIGEAVRRGAIAVVSEERVSLPKNVTAIVVSDSALALSKIADAFYGSPSREITVAGVTGTNGKTTVTQMIASIANAANLSAGIIGTIGTTYAGVERPLSNTTPLASELHALLAQMRETGVKVVAMEVSSHALTLGRTADVRFAVGALTNVTRDHLDFHKTPESYAAAKRQLFEFAERCVFNADDAHGARWAGELRQKKPVLTYGSQQSADLRAEAIALHPDGSTFKLDGLSFEIRIPGRFNVANALCAVAVARTIGISDEVAARGLFSLERVRGRMERVGDGPVQVIVDYAHTPDALENALRALRETASGRRIVVFGCGGDRDRGKRPEMGAVVARHADFAYVTSDNPRTEDPVAIIDAIVPGLGQVPHAVEPDRRKAIDLAVRSAQPGDVVLIAGKGHENYQIVGSEVLPFDDAAEARRALAERERVHS